MADVPHVDLKRQHAPLKAELLEAFGEIIDSGWFVGGPHLAAFEEQFAETCGVAHAIGVANGTDAVKLALRGAGVEAGDEVIVPALTFVATAGAVLDFGAVPVLADVEDATALISAEEVSRRLTRRTKAVVAVHLHGLPCDPAPLRAALEAAGRPDVRLVEDAAQAHGAAWSGKPVGSLADVAAFSFYPTKSLGALGDGGAVTTDEETIDAAVRVLSDHGRPLPPGRRDQHVRAGVNSRLDALQAAALSIKLRRLPEWNARRNEVVSLYERALADRDDVQLAAVAPEASPAWYMFPMRHAKRADACEALGRRGIQARAAYSAPLNRLPALADLGLGEGEFPHAEAWVREVFTLPLFPEITDEEVERVVRGVTEALDEVA